MLYFNVNGDNHMFKIPFSYLENVIESFFNSNAEYEDEICRARIVAVHYSLDSKYRINCIQLISFSLTPLPFFVNIDIEYSSDSSINFSTISGEEPECFWRCNFYRAFFDSYGYATLRLLETKVFSLDEFKRDYFEDMPDFHYDNLPFRPEDIADGLSRDLPF